MLRKSRQTFGLVADRPAHKIALMVDLQFAADMLAVGFNGFKAEIQGQGHARGAVSLSEIGENFIFFWGHFPFGAERGTGRGKGGGSVVVLDQVGRLIGKSLENGADGAQDLVAGLVFHDQALGAGLAGHGGVDGFVVAGEDQDGEIRKGGDKLPGGQQPVGRIHGDIHEDQIGRLGLDRCLRVCRRKEGPGQDQIRGAGEERPQSLMNDRVIIDQEDSFPGGKGAGRRRNLGEEWSQCCRSSHAMAS